MDAARKTRIDTIAGAAEVAQAAKSPIVPPRHVKLSRGDKIFFDSVIQEFAKHEWTSHSCELAAILARAMADLEREQRLVREEGSVVTIKGAAKTNPRQSVVNNLASTILSIRRSLSLQAHAKGGDAADIAKRRSIAKTIEAEIDSGDDLLGLS